MEEDSIVYDNIFKEAGKKHFDALQDIVKSTGELLEGNVMCCGDPNAINEVLSPKRYNLFSLAKNAQNIMEIGFNAGHSALIYLMANDTSKIQFFDISCHKYAKLCFEYLDKEFPGRLSIVWGDSNVILPNFYTHIKYDLVHIDGGHELQIAVNDIVNTKKYCKPDTVVIFDDTNMEYLYDVIRKFMNVKYISHYHLPYYTIHHVGYKYNF
jgi:hypothetical protein